MNSLGDKDITLLVPVVALVLSLVFHIHLTDSSSQRSLTDRPRRGRPADTLDEISVVGNRFIGRMRGNAG